MPAPIRRSGANEEPTPGRATGAPSPAIDAAGEPRRTESVRLVMLPHLALPADALGTSGQDTRAVPRPDAVIRVEGPGAEACLQGVLTNDLVKGKPELAWGAVLTPKGMIITDLWVLRDADGFWLVVPEAGREPLLQVLARSFPPRLAKVTDRSAEMAAWWLLGPVPAGIDGVTLGRPSGPAPFGAMVIAGDEGGMRLLEAAGFTRAEPAVGDLLGVLAGWPSVGREIDEKTLPQEVRFDELEGVKYDKGCYVGQETVARLHFRGHANRMLRAMTGTGDLPEDPTITDAAGKEVGTVATLATLGSGWIATAKVRREVAVGDPVTVGGRQSAVAEFPVDPGALGE